MADGSPVDDEQLSSGSNYSGSDLDDVPLVEYQPQLEEQPRPKFSLGLSSISRDVDADDGVPGTSREPRMPERSDSPGEPGVPPSPRGPPKMQPLRITLDASAIPPVAVPLSTRGPKPPMLALDNPATASPLASPAPLGVPAGNASDIVAVDLLSTALALKPAAISTAKSQGMTVRKYVLARCSGSFGIAPEELRLFELRELGENEDIREGMHVAVHVNNSNFSLTALEEMMHANKQLMTIADRATKMMESSQQDGRDAAANVARMTTRLAEAEATTGRLTQKCETLDTEREELRRQVAKLQEERRQLYNQLALLRSNFDQLRSLSEKSALVKQLRSGTVSAGGALSSAAHDHHHQHHHHHQHSAAAAATAAPRETQTDDTVAAGGSGAAADPAALAVVLQRLMSGPVVTRLDRLVSHLEAQALDNE